LLAVLFAVGAVIADGMPVVFLQSVGTPSMEPTILCSKTRNDSCTATRQASLFAIDYLTLHFRSIRRGDIVVFTPPARLRLLCGDDGKSVWLKRVIGLPGETVKERNSSLYVNGRPVSQPYLPLGERLDLWGPYHVPPGTYFLVGDSRFASCDSRRGVAIPRAAIHGLVRLIWKRPPSFLPG
jgi:signal peptidase I